MENLIELLIFLFIIYAFLLPMLKKKPTVGKKPESEPIGLDSDVKTSEEKSSQEILREIEELFGYKSKEPEDIVLTDDDEFHSFNQEKKVEDTSQKFEVSETQIPERISETEKSQSHSELLMYDYEGTIPEIEIDEFDYSKIDDKSIEQLDSNSNQSDEVHTIVIELKKIDDIKKAIIYKEIFDLPIALRMRKIK